MSDSPPPPPPGFPVPPAPGTGPGPIGVPGGTDRSYQVDIMVCAAITAAIGTVFVILRFYTRRILLRVLGWEDWFILAAQVFSIGNCVAFIIQAVYGLGTHIWDFPLENLPPAGKAGWSAIVVYELSLWCSQMSILLLYLRIWTYPWVRRCTYALLAIVTAYNIFVVVIVFTACVPLQAQWDISIQGAYCHAKNIWWANTYLHVITDFMIYCLPMPVIFRLRFPRRQKVLLFVLFAFGFFVCLISVIRLIMLDITADSMDFLYDNVTIAFWTCVETNATVMVACIMTMKPLLSKWFPNLLTPSQESHESDNQINSPAVDPTGRVLTIGSKPSRAILAQHRRSWTLFRSRNDDRDLGTRHEEKDLEAAVAHHSDGASVGTPGSKATDSVLRSFPSSGTTLEDETLSRTKSAS